MSWWVGAYIEAGMGAGGNSGTPYLAFAFQAPNKATAEKDAGAKLLAGPFATQAQADKWAGDYNTNPKTVQAGSGLSKSTGTATAAAGEPPGAGALANSLNGANPLTAIGDFLSRLTEANTWIRLAKIVVGGALLIIGLSHLTGADNAVANAARRAPLPIL